MALYQSFGVGAAEVEVDCVTGERSLLRADIMFDAGKSVSPAIDMGQVSNCPSVCLSECLDYLSTLGASQPDHLVTGFCIATRYELINIQCRCV
jgi:hypothetical protein